MHDKNRTISKGKRIRVGKTHKSTYIKKQYEFISYS